MPRYAAWLKGAGGSFAVVHSSKPIKACGICQAKLSAYLCDYPANYPVGAKTCDAPLCEDCRVSRAPEIDWCPTHDSEVSHPIKLSEDSHAIDKSHTSQMTQMVDELAQERLL